MKNVVRNRLAYFLILLILISSTFGISFSVNNNLFYQMGLLQKEKITGSRIPDAFEETEYKITANNFKISIEDFNYTVKELQLAGMEAEKAEEQAAKLLIEKYAVYNAAVAANCIAGDEAVRAVIEDTKAGIERASNKADFYDFLSGVGMTADEYWESQFNNVKIYESIDLYKEQCYQSFLQKASEADSRSDVAEDKWDQYWDNIVAELISSENVQIKE